MESTDLKLLIAGQTAMMAFFLVQKGVEWWMHRGKMAAEREARQIEKKDATLDDVVRQVAQLQVAFAEMKAKVDVTLHSVLKIQNFEVEMREFMSKVGATKP